MTVLSRDYRVGMFVSLGLVILAGLTLMYGQEPMWFLTMRYELAVIVDSPRGIREGTPGFLQGVQVGRVEEIRLQDPDHPSRGAAVILGIDKSYDIPQGWRAKIHPVFGFGQGEIHIYKTEAKDELPGQSSEIVPLPKDGSAYIYGEMVGALESIVPQEYIETLGKAVNQIGEMASGIKQVSTDLHDLLEFRPIDEVDDPENSLEANANTVIQRLDESLRLINGMLDEKSDGDLQATVANIREATEHFKNLTRRVDDRADKTLDHIDETIQAFHNRLDEVGKEFAAALDRFSRVLDALNTMFVAINEGKGAIGKAIYDEKLYEELLDTLERLQRVMDELTALVKVVESDGLRAIY